jgi:Na+/melibiose symporter-like transporter
VFNSHRLLRKRYGYVGPYAYFGAVNPVSRGWKVFSYYCVPDVGWKPAGFVPDTVAKKLVTTAQVSVDVAWKTPQFWLLWLVLCMNVTAGIGVLARASPMAQEMFGVSAAVAGGFVGLLCISNMVGRFLWSSFSDVIGRKGVYCVFFLLGCVLYLMIPYAQKANSVALFVGVACVIISMYAGGLLRNQTATKPTLTCGVQ